MLVAAAMLTASCGVLGSDDGGTESGAAIGSTAPAGPEASTVDGGGDAVAGQVASSGDPAATDGTTGADPAAEAPASIEELEASWAERRAAVVSRIRTEGYGVGEDGILTGPGGFQLDLDDCPAEWSDSAGVDDTVRIAYTTARSGNLAVYGYVADGMLAYFEY
ncbi:MAG: hypothetical protein AAFO29_15000, partial [Actinomycetota bacterium]